jgi:hypothetical protein
MRNNGFIKIAVILLGLLSSNVLFAAQDPISIQLNSALSPISYLNTANTTTYTITNNLPFAEHPTFTSNNSNFTTSGCSIIAAKSSCTLTATFTPTAVGNYSLQLMMHYDISAINFKIQTTTVSSDPAPVAPSVTAQLTMALPSNVTIGNSITTTYTYRH